MGGFVVALLVANALNIALNTAYFMQLGIYSSVLADTDPVFLRVIVYSFSIFDFLHTATMACLALNTVAEFLHPQTFLRLYATIRSWNAPISAAVYGFYAFQILRLTGSWKIPLVIASLALTQIVGSIIWTVGITTAKSRVDLRVGSGMMMAGTLLCTIGATLCSACVLVSMIFFIRNNPVWRSRIQKELLVDFQLISTRIHVPLMLVTTTDLISYLFLVSTALI
ncbi:hypothetical protein BS47DRAFT_743965 [Hydnum rufescens UP504]|uniref:Uncharacterized protein n=1 Tax=Hydnum rufescens UP504 TaxID=1448309 RepID=A0A9P6DUV1_9AGAM|nr:hypothetical protein BS47DRAFT_743965 [Hydnum rufescens UP504]